MSDTPSYVPKPEKLDELYECPYDPHPPSDAEHVDYKVEQLHDRILRLEKYIQALHLILPDDIVLALKKKFEGWLLYHIGRYRVSTIRQDVGRLHLNK